MNKLLQQELDYVKKKNKGIWMNIETEYGIHLGVADKFLIINKLRNSNDSWDELWKDIELIFKDFKYEMYGVRKYL